MAESRPYARLSSRAHLDWNYSEDSDQLDRYHSHEIRSHSRGNHGGPNGCNDGGLSGNNGDNYRENHGGYIRGPRSGHSSTRIEVGTHASHEDILPYLRSDHTRQDRSGYIRQDRSAHTRQDRSGHTRQDRSAHTRQDQSDYARQDQSCHTRQDRSGHNGGNRDSTRNGTSRHSVTSGASAHCSREGKQNSMHHAQVMSKEDLQTYSQISSDEVFSYACQNETIFLNTFKKKYFCNHTLHLKQLIKLLYLLVGCDNRVFVALKLAEILSMNGDSDGFIVAIEKMLKKMPQETRHFIKTENISCIGHLVEIGLVAIRAVPSTVLYRFPVPALQQTAKDLARHGEDLGAIVSALETLEAAFEEEKEKFVEVRKAKTAKKSIDKPIELFTDLPILPTLQELTITSKEVYLRPNIVSGGYKSWEHYFDIQFRLLREDFIRPLRRGIAAYHDTGSSRGISDVRVYHNTRILNPVCLFSSMGFEIKFDVSNLRNFKWEHSRLLIFGSYLCLSNDEFCNHMMFATVVKRDPKLLREGKITIKFEDRSNPFAIDPSTVFTMIESAAYFEAYRYILERLQRLSRSPNIMPMKSYIVDCDYDEINIPAFLNVPALPPIFDLSSVIEMKESYVKTSFDVTDDTKWPLSHTTQLDGSQLEALKVSLTQEMAVIQGPPGTGKTYIGLKIVEAYLKNRLVWDPKKSSPILVVCYTNHTLDQFLEGICLSASHDTNIIRIGGRSKSATLSNYTLRERFQKAQAEHSIPSNLFGPFKDARAEMAGYPRIIEKKMRYCDAEAKNKIVELFVLGDCVSELHTHQLLYQRPTEPCKEIEVWLELWYPEEPQGSSLLRDEDSPNELYESEESSEEDLYIEVDNESRVLEDNRMIEGEEIALLESAFELKPPQKIIKAGNKKSEKGWSIIKLTEKRRNQLMQKGFDNIPMAAKEAERVHDVWHLSIKQRWTLYLYWMNEYTSQCRSQIGEVIQSYNEACERYKHAKRQIECYVAKKVDVIGMTTTGAAKYHHLLEGLHPKIAIFEEAAEVLEAHLVTSIASSVQQVILIGDHKQLRPKPNCFDLEIEYDLGISLFERLVDPIVNPEFKHKRDSGFPYVTLEVQHRMRPEISKLVHPSIYKRLMDAKNVKSYDHVKGISKDLFFICHAHPEEHNSFGDSKSHVNKFEADYASQLCLYLLKQGYLPGEITILSMYRGQLLELKNKMKRTDFQGVRVAAVDDFQGEENEIIILSLVRSTSNPSAQDKIGFLSIENRVCVSLSRAKIGLYIIGNGYLLKKKKLTKWPEIIHYLEQEKCYGRHLNLYCQNHPQDVKVIENPGDFKNCHEGGCQKECGERLPCGHACPRLCHIRNSDHKSVVCTKMCHKPLSCGHFCQSKCLQCKKFKKCKPCTQHTKKYLPRGNRAEAICSARVEDISCPVPCNKTLPCKHQCLKLCSQPCTLKCTKLMMKKFPCSHHNEVECFKEPNEVSCSHRCGVTLECGDTCEGTCGSCKQGRLHMHCKEKCGRTLMCGHNCDFPCANICPPCNKACNNYCIHSKCPKKCYEPCEPCMEQCEWNCPHFTCSKPCGQLCNRPHCDKPCYKTLECGHSCIGLCGERCPNKCLICDKDEVCAIFLGREEEEDARYIQLQDCDHIFEVRDLDQWMNINARTTKEEMVMFKSCPRCNKSIRKSVRYGNQIKQVLLDVDAIKSKQQNDSSRLFDNHRNALKKLEGLKNREFVSNEMLSLSQEIMDEEHQPDSFRAAAINLQLTILPSLLRLKNIADDCIVSDIQVSGYSLITARRDIFELKSFLMHRYLPAQQCSDITYELRQISCLVKLLDLFGKLTVKARSISQQDLIFITDLVKTLHQIVPSITKVTEATEAKCMNTIKNLSEHYHVNGLLDKEKIQIVAAVGLDKGHWYKCPNGHFYCIGECGGAMMTSKCPIVRPLLEVLVTNWQKGTSMLEKWIILAIRLGQILQIYKTLILLNLLVFDYDL